MKRIVMTLVALACLAPAGWGDDPGDDGAVLSVLLGGVELRKTSVGYQEVGGARRIIYAMNIGYRVVGGPQPLLIRRTSRGFVLESGTTRTEVRPVARGFEVIEGGTRIRVRTNALGYAITGGGTNLPRAIRRTSLGWRPAP